LFYLLIDWDYDSFDACLHLETFRMAAARSKLLVGSAQWILDERKQANQLVEDEVEEFGYSVRNEMEWLNEHMAEIFSSNQLYASDLLFLRPSAYMIAETLRTYSRRLASYVAKRHE